MVNKISASSQKQALAIYSPSTKAYKETYAGYMDASEDIKAVSEGKIFKFFYVFINRVATGEHYDFQNGAESTDKI